MEFAIYKEKRIKATKGARGYCPICDSELIAKCGEVNIHHWSHKTKCTDHWSEPETPWHRNWKAHFPKEWREVVQHNKQGKKVHQADIETSDGWVIEFQHSRLEPEMRRARNTFYKKLIWVVDGTRRSTDIRQFQDKLNEANFVYYKPLLFEAKNPEECRLLKEWSGSGSLMFVDFGATLIGYKDGYSSTEDLWLLYSYSPKERVFLSHLSRSNFIELLNGNRCNEIFEKLINPIQKEIDKYIAQEEVELLSWQKMRKEQDEKIRRKYGIKDDEDYFDGRNGIRIFKRSEFN